MSWPSSWVDDQPVWETGTKAYGCDFTSESCPYRPWKPYTSTCPHTAKTLSQSVGSTTDPWFSYNTQTQAHTSCLCATTSGALGKEEAGSGLQPLEQLMSTWIGSRINCSSSGSPTPGCPISWETYSSSFTTWQAIKRWTIKPLEKKTTTSRRLLWKQHIWPMHWCQWPSRMGSTWLQATETTSQCFSTLVY